MTATPDAASAAPQSRALIIIASVIGVIIIFFAGASIAIFLAFGCGGDGGVPFAALDSQRGRFCDSGELYNTYLASAILGPPIAVVVGAVLAAKQRVWRPLLMSMAAGAILIVAATVFFLGLNDDCTDGQINAGERCESY